MKKQAKALLSMLLAAAALLAGCHSMVEEGLETKHISATFYPIYALALNIVEDVPGLSLTCLIQPQDGCMRDYELSDWDFSVLAGQDLVLLGGRGLELFEGALHYLPNEPILISCMEGLRLREGMEGEAGEDYEHFYGDNPWTFLSVSGAMEMSVSLAAGMARADPDFAAAYSANLEKYMARLEALISDMSDIMAPAPYRPVALLHEGLSYFAGQFAMNVVLTYPREPGVDLRDNDLEDLISALEGAGVQAVLIEEQAPARLVAALEEAGYPVARVDTLSAHGADGDAGAYERIMLDNARQVRNALERTR